MAMTVLTATIAAGGSLSNAALIPDDHELRRIIVPAGWTLAPLTFQLSVDDISYNDVFDQSGREMQYPITPGTVVIIELKFRIVGSYLKLRSGTREHPVTQPAARAFGLGLVIKP